MEEPQLSEAQAVAAEPDPVDLVRWEYLVVRTTFTDSLERELNSLGARGWEVVTLAGLGQTWTITGNKLVAVLKRRSALLVEEEARPWSEPTGSGGKADYEFLRAESGDVFDEVWAAYEALGQPVTLATPVLRRACSKARAGMAASEAVATSIEDWRRP